MFGDMGKGVGKLDHHIKLEKCLDSGAIIIWRIVVFLGPFAIVR